MSDLTVAAGLVRGLMDLAVSKGADRRLLQERTAIDPRDLEDQDGRVPVTAFIALMRAGKTMSGDRALGLHFGERDLSDMSILGLLGPRSQSVADAVARLNRYARLAIETDPGQVDRFHLDPVASGAWLVDTRPDPDDFPELTEATVAGIARGVAAIAADAPTVGRTPLLRAVHVTHPDPGYRTEYERVTGAPVSFESTRNAILFDRAVLASRVPRQPRYAFDVMTERAEVLLGDLESAKTTRGRVERVLAEHLRDGDHGVDAVAASLGMSRWTLFRRLQAEGVTFRAVHDELRHRSAVRLLDSGDATLDEIAALLGFSERAAFSRAFRRWTGASPRSARRSPKA